jgi:hypothetical protein
MAKKLSAGSSKRTSSSTTKMKAGGVKKSLKKVMIQFQVSKKNLKI